MKPWLLAIANRKQPLRLAALVLAVGGVVGVGAGERARVGGVLRAGRGRSGPSAL